MMETTRQKSIPGNLRKDDGQETHNVVISFAFLQNVTFRWSRIFMNMDLTLSKKKGLKKCNNQSDIWGQKIDYPGEGPTTDWVVYSGVLAKRLGVKSVVCPRVLRGRLCVENLVWKVGVQSVGVE